MSFNLNYDDIFNNDIEEPTFNVGDLDDPQFYKNIYDLIHNSDNENLKNSTSRVLTPNQKKRLPKPICKLSGHHRDNNHSLNTLNNEYHENPILKTTQELEEYNKIHTEKCKTSSNTIRKSSPRKQRINTSMAVMNSKFFVIKNKRNLSFNITSGTNRQPSIFQAPSNSQPKNINFLNSCKDLILSRTPKENSVKMTSSNVEISDSENLNMRIIGKRKNLSQKNSFPT